jgi:hypothetical protein
MTVLCGGALASTAQAADLAIDVAPMEPLNVGYDEEFTVTASNVDIDDYAGPAAVSVPLPATMTFVSAQGSGWSCALAGGIVTCATNQFVGAETAYPAITLIATPGPAAVPTIGLTFTAIAPEETDPTDNAVTRTYPVAYFDDLSIRSQHLGLNWKVGQSQRYRVTVTNNGSNNTGWPVVVTTQAPAGFAVTAVDGGADWVCATAADGLITCNGSAVVEQHHSFAPIVVTGTLTAAAVPRTTSSATVTYPGDEFLANNTSTDNSFVGYLLEVSMGITAPASMTYRKASTLRFVADADGTQATTGPTTMSISLPPGLPVVRTTASAGWTCTAATPIVCTMGPGKRALPAIQVSVMPTRAAAPAVTVAATVTTDGDQNPATNTAVRSIPVVVNCVVPRLKGVSRKQAKALLIEAACTAGKVKTKPRPKKLRGKRTKQVVISQKRGSGSVFAADARVGFTLGYVRKH